MGKKNDSLFWVGYSDLFTSLFFVILVLFVFAYINQQRKVEELEKVLKVFKDVEKTIEPLKNDPQVFRYEENYKRFVLGFDVKFVVNKSAITNSDLENYELTKTKIINAGHKLIDVLDKISNDRKNDSNLKNVSYVVIISGYASNLGNTDQKYDYELSYKRAFNLFTFWKSQKINFEKEKYKDFVDLQISGNGWGGIGRIQTNEKANQRFIIQIVPKVNNEILL